MKDSDIMPFGKHKGEKLGDVPADYLLWLGSTHGFWEQKHPGLRTYIESGRAHLEKEAKNKNR